MGTLNKKLVLRRNGTIINQCTIYNNIEEATPSTITGGNYLKLYNNAYVGLWPKSIISGGNHSILTATKNNISYWVETIVVNLFNLESYASRKIENYRQITTIPNNIISELTDVKVAPNAAYAFNDCSNLTSINLPNMDMSRVTNMTSMFAYCNNVTNISGIANWNTSSLVTMNSMFFECQNIVNFENLSNWDTSNVTSMSSLFWGCSNLKNVDFINNWNTSNVTDMSGTFYSCENLINPPSIPNNVTNMSSTFYNCTKLEGDLYIYSDKVSNVSGCFDGRNSSCPLLIVRTNNPSTTYNAFKAYLGGVYNSNLQVYLTDFNYESKY